jgi:hypothetical protein
VNRWKARVKQSVELEDYKDKWRRRSLTSALGKRFSIDMNATDLSKPILVSPEDRFVAVNPRHELFDKFPRKEREFLKDILFAVAVSRAKFPRHEDLFSNLNFRGSNLG